MTKTALLVVDMQNDFLTGSLSLKECPAHEDGEEIVEVINSLAKLPHWDLVVYTLDWHPQDHISFVTNAHKFVQHRDSTINKECAEVYDTVIFSVDDSERREQCMWPPHCIQGSWGSEFHKDLQIPEGSLVVKKGSTTTIDSYSAFYDNNQIQETELRQLLESHGIKRTFVCGVATDVCVNYTAFDSHNLGFKTIVIEDACRGVNADHIREVLSKMEVAGIGRIKSAEVAVALTKPTPQSTDLPETTTENSRSESC